MTAAPRALLADFRDMAHRIARIDARSSAMFAGLDIPAFEADAAGKFTMVNRAFEALTGYSARDLLGFGWKNVLHPADADDFLDQWLDAVRDRRILRRTIRLLTQQETIVPVCIDAQPMRDGGVDFLGWFGTVELEAASRLVDLELRIGKLEQDVQVIRREDR